MFKLSELTKLIKPYARNSAISDEEILNEFLFPFVMAGNVKNKNGEEFHLDKARTSKIMNQKDDVPAKLREALSIYGIADKTREEMPVFVEDYLDPAKFENLIKKLLDMSQQELNIKNSSTDTGKTDLLSDLLTELLLMSLSESNVSAPESILIWKHGINTIEVQTGDLFRYGFENRRKNKNIVVIPVNTAFDTHVTRKIENDPYPVVSENTVHGQWLVRMKESGEQLDQIDARITKSLENGGFLPVSDSKNRHGKTTCYSIGSIAVIETDNAIYFLMAMAQFDDYNNARSTSETIQYLQTCFDEQKPVAEIIHQKMLQHFQRYLVVGGMPAAVQEYVDSGDISKVSAIQRNIIELYKMDFTRYEDEDKKLKLIAIYDQVPSQLMKQNRRFNFSDIKKGLRFERLEDSFLWLSAAGVVVPVYNATEPRVALSQNAKSSLLKLYSSDVGLLTCQYGNAIRVQILTGSQFVNLGGVYENAVAQELNAHRFPMFFYNSHKNGELDFLIEQDFHVVPIEVKSGKDYYVHSAISKVTENPEYEVETAYILANCNISRKGKMLYLPVYMCTFIRDAMQLPILPPI